jgi:hypothetical protein
MSATYWDPELGRGGGGGEPQQLELNGFTLSLVPDGGSVELPVGYVSSLGSVLIVSSVLARDSVVVGPSSNVIITSTGQITANVMLPQLLNALAVNATNTTTTSLSTTNGQITNLFSPNANATQLNALSISSGMINTSSIKAGGITISKDTGIGYTKVTGDQITFYQNINQDSPGQNINGRFFNGENYNATSSINVGSNIIASNVNSNAIITLNNHVLSNTANNLTYDSNPIYTGQRGDVSQWAQFPANGFVNANGNGVGGIGTLYVDGEANLANKANIGTNKQDSEVNILTTPYSGLNPFYPVGKFNLGFRRYAPGGILPNNSTQPDINVYGRTLNMAAGAPDLPAYLEGRTINIDAYAGLSPVPSIVPVLPNANSYINITAHGNSVSALNKFLGAGSGNITLRAYNSYFPPGVVPNPLAPGRIYLDAARVDIGNANYTGLGQSALVNLQSAIIQLIAGVELGSISPFGEFAHTRIRSREGVSIENTPFGNNNRDSKLWVREIVGYSNFVGDFGPPALTLDGLDGGLTLNNFVAANGQGDGADLNNIASMTGAYPTNVQNQINALQNTIANLSTTGGTSNIAQWSAFPALSTIVATKDINFTGTTASISSLNGIQFNNTAGSLTNTYQKRVYIDGRSATTGSSMMYYDASSVAFINPSSLAYNDIRGQGFYFGAGQSNYLGVSSGVLLFNNQALISTNGAGGGGGGSFGNNPLVSTLKVNYASGFVQIGTQQITNVGLFADVNVLGVQDSNGGVRPIAAFPVYSGYYGGGYTRINNQSIDFMEPASGTGFNFASFDSGSNIGLSNISSINGLPISTFTGGAGPSTIQNWSYFPVTSNSIQFGNQTAWIKGENNALFTTSNGSNTIPVTAKSFTVFDPDNISVIRNIGFDSNGILTAQRTNTHPSDFRVSSLYMNTSQLTTDGVDLYLNGNNIGSGNTAQWANYPAINTVRGTTLEFSNVNPSLGLIDTTYNPSDPRSTSMFLNPYQLILTNKTGTNRNIFRMVNASNTFMIQNDLAGTNLYASGTLANGNPSQFYFQNDVSVVLNHKFTSPSTLTQGLVVSTIALNNNLLTASNGALYFNGSVVNASNTADNWATFPATSNVNMANYSITNASAISGGSIPSGGFNITTSRAQFAGFQGLTSALPSYDYRSNAITASAGNIACDGSSSNYIVSPYGFAHQQPTGLEWFNTSVNGANGQYQIRQFQANSIVSTGTIYDTVFNPLPTFPITYCTTPGVTRTNVYSGPGLAVLIQMGTFTPVTKQGIVSFQIIPPASYSNAQAWIGCGPNSSANYNDQNNVLLAPRSDTYSGGYWNTVTILCDFTNFLGQPYVFRMDGSANGIFTIKNVQYKPLPN